MQQQRRRDTKPEVALRRELHRRGLRFRVDHPPISGLRRRADIVFGPPRVAVFVDGCFWHMCPEHSTLPTSNADWWLQKLSANVARDRDTDARLKAAGWLVVRVFEHADIVAAADQIEAVSVPRRRARESSL